jgi:hypothetical protein
VSSDCLIKLHYTPFHFDSITTKEWDTAIHFLTRVGQKCTPVRQEFILLSDVLGVSSLVDAVNNPTVGTCTASSVLGPFYNDAPPESVYFLRRIMK